MRDWVSFCVGFWDILKPAECWCVVWEAPGGDNGDFGLVLVSGVMCAGIGEGGEKKSSSYSSEVKVKSVMFSKLFETEKSAVCEKWDFFGPSFRFGT